MDWVEIGKEIRKDRARRGATQAEYWSGSGLDQRQISELERGVTKGRSAAIRDAVQWCATRYGLQLDGVAVHESHAPYESHDAPAVSELPSSEHLAEALDRLKNGNRPELVEHLERQANFLAMIPALAAEVAKLTARIEQLEGERREVHEALAPRATPRRKPAQPPPKRKHARGQ